MIKVIDFNLLKNNLLLTILCLLSTASFGKKSTVDILIINSNQSLQKYFLMESEFADNFKQTTRSIDLGSKWLDKFAVRDAIEKYQPKVILCIGSNAFKRTMIYSKHKPVIFAASINWQRYRHLQNAMTYIIQNKIPAANNLLLFKYYFPEINHIGVLYSGNHNHQWFEEAKTFSHQIGISLVGIDIDNKKEIGDDLKYLFSQVDAFWLISDPILLKNKKRAVSIFNIAQAYKIPIFAYSNVYSALGATLMISADITTLAKQANLIAKKLLNQQPIKSQIMIPAGSHTTLNLGKVKQYQLQLNPKSLSSINILLEK